MQGLTVTAEGIGAGVALLAGIGATVRYVIRAEIGKLDAASEKRFAGLSDEIKVWVNGSFMRSAVVAEQLKSMDQRIEHIETNGCTRRADHE